MLNRVLPITVLCLLSGCLIEHSSNTTHDGTRVAPETLNQIKAGQTTMGWVASTLGAPTSKTRTDEDEVWKYVYTEHTNSQGAIFLIFSGSDTSDKSETAFIEFKNGIVINKWRG
jgi:outer membrane protein assembly factor BamE (lipoprotein component of BamABCDE complex)